MSRKVEIERVFIQLVILVFKYSKPFYFKEIWWLERHALSHSLQRLEKLV